MLELASQQDWEAVNRLSVQIHDLHAAWRPDIYCRTEEPFSREMFLGMIRERSCYVAKLGGIVVGYVIISMAERGGPGNVPCKFLRLESICVEEALRGQGIGKAMMTDVRALARAFGCGKLQLSVHAENDSAIGFYQKCGLRIGTIHMDMDMP